MEDNEPENKVCYTCYRFRRYYSRDLYVYKKSKFGHCCKKDEVVAAMSCCECWHGNYSSLFAGKRSAMKVLAQMLTDLSGIKMLLEEEEEARYL